MPKFAKKPVLTAVWPIVEGLTGLDPTTLESCKLTPFKKGFVEWDNAVELKDEGKLQIMIEETTQSLIQESSVEVTKPIVNKVEVPEKPVMQPKKKVARKRTTNV